MDSTRTRSRTWLLVAAFLVCYGALLPLRPLRIPDEGRYAEIPREMIASGDWVCPRLLGLPYFEKPVGGYWLNALGQLAFGETNFAVRFPMALATGLTALILGLLVRRATGGAGRGLLAATVFLFGFLPYLFGTHAVLDPFLCTFLTLALASFWMAYSAASGGARLRWWIAFGLACGGAFLVKGFVALAVPVVAIVPFMLWQRRWRELLGYGALSVVVATLLALPWSLAVNARNPDYWNFFFWNEHVRRFAGDDAQHARAWWYYLPVLLAMCLPWTVTALRALRRSWDRGVRGADAFQRFLLLAVVAPFLLFSAARGKLATYVLPCFVPLAALVAIELVERGRAVGRRALRADGWCNAILAALLLAGLGVSQAVAERPLFAAGDGAALAVAVGFLLAWLALAVAVAVGRLPGVGGLAATVACAALATPFMAPAALLADTMPQTLLRAHAPQVASCATLACNDVTLAPAVAWEYRRADVVLLGDRGELKYGLDYPEGAGRYVDRQDIRAWIAAARRRGSIAVFFRAKPGKVEKRFADFPEPDRADWHGTTAVLYYEGP